jgi:hypothetical protein
VFNGTDEDDFLYCLPDNKEISVCREIAKSMGFLKLKTGLAAMPKDDLADSLVYNSIKVRKLLTLNLEMKCWGLVLKCNELRTRQHKILNVKVLRPSKHYFP